MSSFQIGPSTKGSDGCVATSGFPSEFRIEVNLAGENRGGSARLVKISLSLQTFGYVLNLIESLAKAAV